MNKSILLGRTEEDDRVTVQIALHPLTKQMVTVEHETVQSGTRLSIQGEVIGYGCREPYSSGQTIDSLATVTRFESPWTKEDVETLERIWRDWHLNDMHPGCVHQTEVVYEYVPYRRVDLDATTAANDCPEGYKYGSAWLYAPLPEDVLEQVRRFQRRLKP